MSAADGTRPRSEREGAGHDPGAGPLLELRDVHAARGAHHVLAGVSLEVGRGEAVAVLGRNGMGKTTLVHTVVGFLRPTAGEVRWKDERIDGLTSERITRRGVTLVPQGRRVFPSLNVGEHLRVAARPGPPGWTIDEVCERFPVLADRWGQPAGLLSGGEQQMLALGRALVGNGEAVLMDEPSEGLDPARVSVVADVVRELARRGVAVLLVEQQVAFALDLVDRVVVLERGEVVHSSDAAAARDDSRALRRALGFA